MLVAFQYAPSVPQKDKEEYSIDTDCNYGNFDLQVGDLVVLPNKNGGPNKTFVCTRRALVAVPDEEGDGHIIYVIGPDDGKRD